MDDVRAIYINSNGVMKMLIQSVMDKEGREGSRQTEGTSLLLLLLLLIGIYMAPYI